ncbi:DUF2177 family protein [Xenophilus arseniciresistens]|uniref:DUF2177 family protein n=1 Tax=Xenophilus arseniciresistens TaxID=1283306 RepID=A0AAE3N5R6_9BURK|nr:DUF2177 family protein [Xenophilus arseniciresistens]MDA7414881.1 DUF2177 family protein [Xenophilus arseniciresistens]
MSPLQIAIAYPLAALVLLALDAVWLSTMAERLYRGGIGHLMAASPHWGAAALFYVIYLAGILFFAVAPALDARRPVLTGLGLGALLGLVAYATFSLTNHATLRDWPWRVTLADLLWGPVLTGLTAAATCLLLPWVQGLLRR